MRVIWKALIAGTFVITAVAISQTKPRSGPVFTKDGDLVLPTGFREWVFMGGPITPNSLNHGEAPFPEFHDVYIEREDSSLLPAPWQFSRGDCACQGACTYPKRTIPGWLTRLGIWPRIFSGRTSWN